jgi:hypothetical protein
MAGHSNALVLWSLRHPATGRCVDCTLVEDGGGFRVAVAGSDDPPIVSERLAGRVDAIHQAARLARQYREKGWVDR